MLFQVNGKNTNKIIKVVLVPNKLTNIITERCKCRIYGANCKAEGAMTIRISGGDAFCPRSGGWMDSEKGNYKVEHD